MEKIPDSVWLASMVVAAYGEERYDLGLALARLQLQAVRIEQAAAPVVLPASVYEPEPEYRQEPLGVPYCGWVWMEGAWHWGPEVVTAASVYKRCAFQLGHEGVHEIAPAAPVTAPQEAPTLVTPSARCIAMVRNEGGERECHGVLYWAGNAGWVHMDGGGGHDPIPDRQIQR